MKTHIIDFSKGLVIGIANVIPGLSGGTIAVVFNVYDKLINALKSLFKTPISALKELWAIILGFIVGVVIAVFVVIHLITNYPIPLTMLFVGLIIGAIPRIYQNIKDEKKTFVDWLVFIVFIMVLLFLPLLPSNDFVFEINVLTIISLFLVGVISAASMVIPGISGSMILMISGFYFYIWTTVGDLVTATLSLSFPEIFASLLPLTPFGIGIIIGIVYISKLISRLFEKYSRTVYCAIIGLLIASPLTIIYSMISEYSEEMQNNLTLNIIIGVITLIIGAAASLYMSSLNNTKDTEPKEAQEIN